MSKDPAILFYTSDFLTGTMFLSDEQTGKYIRLLCAQHQKGRLSEKDMLNICKTHDKDIFNKFKKDSKGFYFNERLENEAKKRKAYSESRRKNREGKKKDMNNISDSYDSHMENENVNENRVVNAFKKNVIEIGNEINISDSIVTEFLNHWTEKDYESKCFAWQVPENFIIKSRLKGWNSGIKKNNSKIDGFKFPEQWKIKKMSMTEYQDFKKEARENGWKIAHIQTTGQTSFEKDGKQIIM